MTTTYPNGQEPPRLLRGYFSYPQLWRFNSPDFYLFYYVLSAIFSVLLIGLLLLLLAGNKQQQHAAVPVATPVSVASPEAGSAAATLPPASEAPAVAVTPAPTQAPTPTPVPEATSPQLLSAEEQPSYALRAEAYDRLRNSPEVGPADKLKAIAAFQKYQGLDLRAQQRLERALDGIEKEHYSVSINTLNQLIAQGEILGDVYIKAQEALPKAHFKKIDYYLIEGRLTQARRALNEARAAKISPDALKEYEEKIIKLEKVGK